MAEQHGVLVVGGSAGGLEALRAFAAQLGAGLPMPVLAVLHIAPDARSTLASILDRVGPLPAATARDGETAEAGRIYVAGPDCHLVLERGGVMRGSRGPREHGHRPAVDPLFRSAAACFGPAAIGVVLSGVRDDGTAGAAAIKAAGGRVLVQDPEDALYPSMPEHVLAGVSVDGRAPAGPLGALVTARLRDEAVDDPERAPAALAGPSGPPDHTAGEPGASGFTCPECGGAIYIDAPDGVTQLSCHTGHVYSPATFTAEQQQVIEAALWSAVRRLEERAALLTRLADQVRGGHQRFAGTAAEAKREADVIRELIFSRSGHPA